MADKRALKWIGIIVAALTLTVISTAAAVVGGHAGTSVRPTHHVPGLLE